MRAFGGLRAVWHACLFLLVGFAFVASGLAGSVVSPSSSSLLLHAKVDLHVGLSGTQMRSARISGLVPILRLRQPHVDPIPDTLRSRALDRSERKRRVRVQSFD